MHANSVGILLSNITAVRKRLLERGYARMHVIEMLDRFTPGIDTISSATMDQISMSLHIAIKHIHLVLLLLPSRSLDEKESSLQAIIFCFNPQGGNPIIG